jgi:hypothetical protein
MKRNEKQLLLLAGALFALVLVVRVVPMIYNYYQQGQEDIALLQERVERYTELILSSGNWMERKTLKEAEIADLQSWIFEGANPNLISSSVQRSLRQAMEQAKVTIRETSVARYSYVGDWLMVSQDMNFTIDQQNILPFLTALQNSRPRLHVTAFNVTRNRRQYTGSITVAGFGRTPQE